ncbi:hypothetical protein GME_02985 [Halomonas sp. TD01]|nr:hypothetical protein GME_02985 [Halomonas sp. TD01]
MTSKMMTRLLTGFVQKANHLRQLWYKFLSTKMDQNRHLETVVLENMLFLKT